MAEPAEYFFDSTGGCARCDAMHGLHRGRPARPHPFCRCKVQQPKKFRKKFRGGCFDLELTEKGAVSTDTGAKRGKVEIAVEVEYSYTIKCKRLQTTHTGTIKLKDKLVVTKAQDEKMSAKNPFGWLELMVVKLATKAKQQIDLQAARLCKCGESNLFA